MPADPTPRKTSLLGRTARQSIFDHANQSPRIQSLIASCEKDCFIEELRKLAQNAGVTIELSDGAQLEREILTFISNKQANMSQDMLAALKKRSARKKRLKNAHHDAVRELGLDWSLARVAEWNAAIPSTRLSKLEVPYPPPGTFVCEDECIKNLWHHWLMEKKQADKRLKRCRPLVIADEKLVRTVAPGEDLVVRDSESGEIALMVVRQFVRDIDIIDWMESVVVEAAEICRNIRKEDPGHLSIAGFSAGSRSQPQFHWARNVIHKLSEGAIFDFRQRQSWAFGLFWNLLLKRLPLEIVDEWKGWLESEMLPRMSPSWSGQLGEPTCGTCEFPTFNGVVVKLHGVDCAPPSGVMAQNYARAIHYEKQPHKWAASLTLSRDGFEDGGGGHFFLASHGIRVASAPDTLIVWQPELYHGTSLQKLNPSNPDPHMLQRGMAFVTSSRLPGIWEQYAECLKMVALENASQDAKTKKAEQAVATAEVALFEASPSHDDIYFADENV